MHFHRWIGLFALLTAALAGAAIGRILDFSAGEGAYLSLFSIALIGWRVGRRARRQEQRR